MDKFDLFFHPFRLIFQVNKSALFDYFVTCDLRTYISILILILHQFYIFWAAI
jgi:hypothetical protein